VFELAAAEDQQPVKALPAHAADSALPVSKQPTASWGNPVASAPEYYTTLAFNLLGDGLREAFDQRSTH
jgi:hypothetical protein